MLKHKIKKTSKKLLAGAVKHDKEEQHDGSTKGVHMSR